MKKISKVALMLFMTLAIVTLSFSCASPEQKSLANARVASNGLIVGSSGNVSVTHASTGVFDISFSDFTWDENKYYVLANICWDTPRFISWYTYSGQLTIMIWNISGNPADDYFDFAVYSN